MKVTTAKNPDAMKRLLPSAILVALSLATSCDAVNNADNPANSGPMPASNEPQTSDATLRDAGSMMDDTASALPAGDTATR